MRKTKQLPSYPLAPSQPVTEDYFGTSITDDFRNFENLDDPAVQKWLKEERDYANNVLDNIPIKKVFAEKMLSHFDRKPFVVTQLRITDDDQHFYLKRTAEAKHARLFYRKDSNSPEELLYDPKDFKPENAHRYLIYSLNPSWDGAHVVLSINHSGHEINEMIIIDMATRQVLPEVIDHCRTPKEGISWLPDNSGFFYWYHPEINYSSKQFLRNTKSVIYRIGEDPQERNVVLSRASHPDLGLKVSDHPIVTMLSSQDQYILGTVSGLGGFYMKLGDFYAGNYNWKRFCKEEDKVTGMAFDQTGILLQTARNADNYQLIRMPLEGVEPSFDNAKILVDARESEVLKFFALTSKGIYFTRIKNGVEPSLYLLKDGEETKIQIPEATGRIGLSNKGAAYPDVWVNLSGWTQEATRYKLERGQLVEDLLSPKTAFPEFDHFVVKEVLVPSHDGVEVPLSIIHQKGISLNGQHPTMINGYGSYGSSLSPFFVARSLTWVELGGVFCIAHVRGGGEKGKAWHLAGKKANKPNSWKDLIACTEYLIDAAYTSKQKIAIKGGSAGGILVGRAMTERPDLFAAVVASVGSMNTLRREYSPNGANVREFGTNKDQEECKALIEMDAYLHLEKGIEYPATLITAGMNDQRVAAWIPGKFAAQLQRFNASDKPIIFDVDFAAGHGGGIGIDKRVDMWSREFAFAFWQTGGLIISN